jgi:hypothetical protein
MSEKASSSRQNVLLGILGVLVVVWLVLTLMG